MSQDQPTGSQVRRWSQIVAIVLICDLTLWLAVDVTVVNPFAATLGLIACPFFYVMGRKMSDGE